MDANAAPSSHHIFLAQIVCIDTYTQTRYI